MKEEKDNKRTLRRKTWWVLVGLILVIGAGGVALRLGSNSGVDAKIERIRQAGLPISNGELNEWYTDVPESNNAALVVLEALDARVVTPRDLNNFSLPEAGQSLSDEAKELIKTHVEANKATLQKLHRSAELSASRYPIDLSLGANTLLPHLAEIKGMAQLLRYEAIQHSFDGNRERAFHSVRSGFALAHTLVDEPTLISELVRIACVGIALNSLEFVLGPLQLQRDDLAALSNALEQAEADGKRASFRSLVAERAGMIAYFKAEGADIQNALGRPTGGWSKVASNAYRVFGFAERDMGIYLETMGQLSAATTNDFPEAYLMSREIERELNRRFSTGLGRFSAHQPGVAAGGNQVGG